MSEKQLECPGCGEMMPEDVLNETNHCDNCGTLAYLFYPI
jgi:uncharacterized Zn finger protein